MRPAAAATVSRLLAMLVGVLLAPAAFAQVPAEAWPDGHLRDRGPGVATSRFGTNVRRREWLVEPAFEHIKNEGFEYDPDELGFGAPIGSFKGSYEAKRGRLFVAYGLSDDLAVELEANGLDATLRKASDDPSSMPAELAESGWDRSRRESTGAGSPSAGAGRSYSATPGWSFPTPRTSD